jgi:hypothetical protein
MSEIGFTEFPFKMDELTEFYEMILENGFKMSEFIYPVKHQPTLFEMVGLHKCFKFQYKLNNNYYFLFSEPYHKVTTNSQIKHGDIFVRSLPNSSGEVTKDLFLNRISNVYPLFDFWLENIIRDKKRQEGYFALIEEPNTVINLSEDKAFTQSELLLLDSHFKRVIHQTKEKINLKGESEIIDLLQKFEKVEELLNELLEDARKTKSKRDWSENSWQRKIAEFIGSYMSSKLLDAGIEYLLVNVFTGISSNFSFFSITLSTLTNWVGVEAANRIHELFYSGLNPLVIASSL